MHYVFFSTGSWESNASMVRPREFGRQMIARGIEVTYAVDDCPFNQRSLDIDPKANVVYTSDLGRVSQFSARRRTLRRLSPDFVHVINPAHKSCAALWGSRLRVVGDWDEWIAMRPYGLGRRMTEKYLDHWLRKRSVLRVVASRYLQEQFLSRYHQSAAYIPYATYLPDHPPTTTPFVEPTAVYVGNFFSTYDHDLLFEAAVLLKARGKTPPIVFLGHGPDLEKWRAFVKDRSLENVQVPGFITGEELWRRLRHAHVLLFPIRSTILNLARCPSKTFAYAQARRPVITNRVGEIPHVLGDKAMYIDPTPEAFADAIDDAMGRELGDVDYGVEAHNWSSRTDALLAAIHALK